MTTFRWDDEFSHADVLMSGEHIASVESVRRSTGRRVPTIASHISPVIPGAGAQHRRPGIHGRGIRYPRIPAPAHRAVDATAHIRQIKPRLLLRERPTPAGPSTTCSAAQKRFSSSWAGPGSSAETLKKCMDMIIFFDLAGASRAAGFFCVYRAHRVKLLLFVEIA